MNIEEAYDQYSRELYRYLAKTFGENDLAQDAAQMAYAKAAVSLPYMAQMPDAAVRAWLYTAARNALIDMLRRRKRLQYDYDFEMLPDVSPVDAADTMALRDGISQLNETQRQLIQMRYHQGQNSSEIAEIMNMPASTVRYHLRMAIKNLRKQLKEEDT